MQIKENPHESDNKKGTTSVHRKRDAITKFNRIFISYPLIVGGFNSEVQLLQVTFSCSQAQLAEIRITSGNQASGT